MHKQASKQPSKQVNNQASKLHEDSHIVCQCGNMFLDDAVFCRKCGARRAGVCICGNCLAADAQFCRKCGRAREVPKTVVAVKVTAEEVAHVSHKFKNATQTSVLEQRTASKSFVHTEQFHVFSACLILANTIYMGIESDFQIRFELEKVIGGKPEEGLFTRAHCHTAQHSRAKRIGGIYLSRPVPNVI